MPRPRSHTPELRTQLLTAAAAQIAQSGVPALSVRGLAALNGTSTSAVYALFGGRAELVQAVLDHAAAQFTASQEAVCESAEPLADLANLGRAYRRWALDNPTLYAVMFGGRLAVPDCAQEERPEPPIAPLYRCITRSIRAGQIRPERVDLIAASIWASVHGWVSLETSAALVPADVADAAYDEHLAGLARAWRP